MAQEELNRGQVYHERYEILERLGGGGFGAVYKARDLKAVTGSGYETVAIKYIASEARFLEPSDRHRLRRQIEQEIRILEKNSGDLNFIPNYIAHWSTPRTDDVLDHYLVMEFVAGKSFKGDEKLEWSSQAMIRFLEDMLGHLNALHRLELYHRDIKPDNIIRREEGGLCIVDFGFANQQTSTILLGLTPDYASPEHNYNYGSVGALADLYCLGATAYHLFSGRRPPQAKHRSPKDRLGFPADARPISRPIEETVLELMAYEPSARPASALQALNRLRDRLRGKALESLDNTVIDPQPTLPTPIEQPTRTKVTSPAPSERERQFSEDMIAETDSVPPIGLTPIASLGHGRITGLNWSPAGNVLLITTATGVFRWQVGQQGDAQKLLDTPAPVLGAALSPDGRQITVAHPRWIERRSLPQNNVLMCLPGDPVSEALVSSDGTIVVTAGDTGVVIWQVAPNLPQHPIPGDATRPDRLALSGDGSTLAMLNDDRLTRKHLTDNELHNLPRLRGLPGLLRDIALNHDGSRIATLSERGVQLWDEEGNPISRPIVVDVPTESIEQVVLDRTGDRVAIASSQAIFVRSLDTAVSPWQAPISEGSLVGLAFSPDAATVAAATTHKVWAWRLEAGQQPITIWEDNSVEQLAFFSDGKLLVVGSQVRRYSVTNKVLELFDSIPTTVRSPRGIATHSNKQRHLLALADVTQVQLWEVKKGPREKQWKKLEPLPSSAAQMDSIAFSAQGRQIVNFTLESIETWQIPREPGAEQFHTIPGPIFDAALSADSTTLATYDGDSIQIWHAGNGGWHAGRKLPANDRALNTIALSREGDCLAMGSEKAVRVCRTDDGEILADHRGEGWCAERLVFGVKGDVLAAIAGAQVRLWSIANGLQELTLARGHTEAIYDLALDAEHALFATASHDGTLRLWSYEEPST